MLVKAYGSAVCGIEAITVTIEAEVSPGINFHLVGLPDSAVRESQQRVSTAVHSVGLRIPCKRIVINMAPADIRKEGSAYDLPLALAVLAASEQIRAPMLDTTLCMGELALDGALRPIRGRCPWRCMRGIADSGHASFPWNRPARRPWWKAWTCTGSRTWPKCWT